MVEYLFSGVLSFLFFLSFPQESLEDSFLLLPYKAISYIHQHAGKSIFETDKSTTSTAGLSSLTHPLNVLLLDTTFWTGPILENGGTIEGTYEVIDMIFQRQLNLNEAVDFKRRLLPAYGDQKTVSLVQSVKRERQYCENTYGRYQWLLPIP